MFSTNIGAFHHFKNKLNKDKDEENKSVGGNVANYSHIKSTLASPGELVKKFQKQQKTKELRCRFPVVNMRYNQFNEKYGEVFEKHITELEQLNKVKEKKRDRNKLASEYQSKHSTRISNQSSIIQYSKDNLEKIRKEFEDKFGHSALRSNAT